MLNFFYKFLKLIGGCCKKRIMYIISTLVKKFALERRGGVTGSFKQL